MYFCRSSSSHPTTDPKRFADEPTMSSRRMSPQGDWTSSVLFWRSPRSHLYLVAAGILFTVWAVELDVFNVAASEAACPWPGRDRTTSKWSSSSTDDDVHILVMADPQILGNHAYPGLPPLLHGLPPWLADHYIRKAYRALMRKATTNGSERVDAVVWLGDLTDEGRRVQDDGE